MEIFSIMVRLYFLEIRQFKKGTSYQETPHFQTKTAKIILKFRITIREKSDQIVQPTSRN